MKGRWRFLPVEIGELLQSNPAPRAVLLTDFLVRLAELSALVILPWWITSSGGASAIAAFGATLALATFIAVPAVSPFGDRICKGCEATWGLACLSTGVDGPDRQSLA